MSLKLIKKTIADNWENIRQNFKQDNHEFVDDQIVAGLTDLYTPQNCHDQKSADICDILLEHGKIDQDQLNKIRSTTSVKDNLAELLIRSNLVSTDDILIAQATLEGFEFRNIEPEQVDKQAYEKLNANYIKTNRVIPFAYENDKLIIATSRPNDIFIIDDIKRQIGTEEIKIVLCSDDNITKIYQSFDTDTTDYCVDDIIQDISQNDVELVEDKKEDIEDLAKMAGESPIIKFVNYLITHAISEGASDIHIEPKQDHMKVRYRIDGILFEAMRPTVNMHPAVVSRIKIMSNLDISERRVPQDGKIAVIIGGRKIDLRVSTLPTSHGEKVVIRVLDSSSILLGLEQLGMETDTLNSFGKQVEKPNGIMLVTGPTGSGKTTTLYSALNQMDGEKLNVSTVEDPVEYQLDFTNQVQVNEKAGLDFAGALRSLLRQDPDVIMIGEIRDTQTARIAVQAALTGHLVLSTLHTNDAPSSISRLVDIGVEPYLIAASLNSVLAQRLVRKICPNCKRPLNNEESERMKNIIAQSGLNPDQLAIGDGCDHCRNSGYSGRLGIYELLIVENNFRQAIVADTSIDTMRKIFKQSGRKSLYQDGISKVAQGLTTFDEVLRVTELHETEQNE